MRKEEAEKRAGRKIHEASYIYTYYLNFDYSLLSTIKAGYKRGSSRTKKRISYNSAYIMLDTETSKSHSIEYDSEGKAINQVNHVCAWTISIRAYHKNICTLRGSRPSEIIECLRFIRENLVGDAFFVFVHNLPYDWFFIRRFLFEEFGLPESQLNVKSHYPITIQFKNGMILRDSYILAGVSLERWANNLDVEHKKAVGFWNYDLIRNQNAILNDEELTYIENDTLAGVECLNKLADILNDSVYTLPFTNTGIVRRDMRRIGREKYAKKDFNKQLITLEELGVLEKVYHGGYTHANRNIINYIINNVECEDFKSSYPYAMLTTKVPREPFTDIPGYLSPEQIVNDENNAYIFKLVLVKPRLKDVFYPMPSLQFYKCDASINAIKDNGRILEADYIEIYMNELDLLIVLSQYDYDEAYCVEVKAAYKDYMPRWFRDFVFDTFKEKCELEYQIKVLKQGDMSLYNSAKARLNSLYGMAVTKPIKEDIIEQYESDNDLPSGEYYLENMSKEDYQKKFDKYLKSRNQILPYVFGVWTTSAAMYNLFELSNCIDDINKHWIYSDTDSIYSDGWNREKLVEYNKQVTSKLESAGYGSVTIGEKSYTLGVADFDGLHNRFITQGAKRYAVEDNKKIKITVAGVPKKAGATCLRRLEDFKEGFVFYGQGTGKKTHTYILNDIFIDESGNECADSIDLTDADYTLSSVDVIRPEQLFMEEVTQEDFEE